MFQKLQWLTHTGADRCLKIWLSAHCTLTGIGRRPIPNGRQADKNLECPNGLSFDKRGEDKRESWYRAFLDGAILLASRESTLGVGTVLR